LLTRSKKKFGIAFLLHDSSLNWSTYDEMIPSAFMDHLIFI